jgi:cytochrome P450
MCWTKLSLWLILCHLQGSEAFIRFVRTPKLVRCGPPQTAWKRTYHAFTVSVPQNSSPSLLRGAPGTHTLTDPVIGSVAVLDWVRHHFWHASPSSWALRLAAALLVSALIYRFRATLLWPGAKPDPSLSEPLPPGGLGCPWIGNNILAGSKKLGPEYFYRKVSKRLGDPRVWKFYFMGSPVAAISGKELVQKFNALEYMDTEALGATYEYQGDVDAEDKKEKEQNKPKIFGSNNVMFERNKKRHEFLRKLVGSAMTPQAITAAVSTMQETARATIESEILQKSEAVKMENVCVDYTMDITQNQILGLSLPHDEVLVFREKLKVWLKAMYQLIGTIRIPWIVKRSAAYKARLHIESKINDKIDSLIKGGPDSSTISNLLFAVDENNKKLSREDVVENALLLVIAGSETSAGTLTLANLLLGLHPDKYQKIVEEQEAIVKKNGVELTLQILDNEMPYLDAVLKETLRMGAVTGGFPRRAKSTIAVDGVQIPKGWGVFTTYRLTHQLDPITRLPNDEHMDPRKGFVPERWFQAETTPSDYVPFGSGPRYCLGANLAMAEMKIFLSMMARLVPKLQLVNKEKYQDHVEWHPSTMIPRPNDGLLIQAITTSNSPSPDA